MTDPSTSNGTARRSSAFPWPPALFIAAVTAAALAARSLPLPWPGLDDTPSHVIGLGFGIAGFSLIALALKALRDHDTTVLPNETSTTLVTDGIYRRFRNPIYLGQVLILLTIAEVTKSIWFIAAAAAFAVLVTVLQIVPEERHLEARFGEAYLAYKASTRRWI